MSDLRKEVEALRSLLADQQIELGLARAQGVQSMRDAVLRWHQEQWVKYREQSGTNAIAGAYMGAHGKSFVEISTWNLEIGLNKE